MKFKEVHMNFQGCFCSIILAYLDLLQKKCKKSKTFNLNEELYKNHMVFTENTLLRKMSSIGSSRTHETFCSQAYIVLAVWCFTVTFESLHSIYQLPNWSLRSLMYNIGKTGF